MNSSSEVFTQIDTLVSKPTVEGAAAITQLEVNNDNLYVVTFDHNVIVHQISDLSLVKQVIFFSGFSLYIFKQNALCLF